MAKLRVFFFPVILLTINIHVDLGGGDHLNWDRLHIPLRCLYSTCIAFQYLKNQITSLPGMSICNNYSIIFSRIPQMQNVQM